MQILASLMRRRNCKQEVGANPQQEALHKETNKAEPSSSPVATDNRLYLSYPFYLRSFAPLNHA